jgi:hypothetical protein
MSAIKSKHAKPQLFDDFFLNVSEIRDLESDYDWRPEIDDLGYEGELQVRI